MEDGKISYVAELDDKGFAEGARSIQRQVRDVTSRIEKDGSRIDEVFDKIGSRMKQAFAISSIVAFEKKIIDVRSEMESLQKSFESLAGEHIGRKLYEDIKQFATTTPMMAKDLAKGAQTLLGFNIEAEKVMPILRQIGDISMGDAQKFNSLTLAFAQMSSTGKLMGQDLLQMVNAGFNPLVVISEKTGKSIAQLKDEMSEGKITVEMVEEAFRSATAEGGKFHNMLEDQSKGIKGALSNLQGAYEDMLDEIGEKQQGLMLKGVELAQTIVQNYEKVGQVLLGLIATYGTYRTAVMAVSVAEGIANGQIVLKIRALRACAAAQALLNKTMLANPYVLAATALGAVVSALITFRSKSDEASEAQKKLSEAFGETQAKIATEEKNIDSLFGKLRKAVKGTQEYKDAKKAIIDQYGQYFNGLDSEIEKVGGVELAYKKLTKAVRESAMARGKEAAMQQANDTYNSTYSDYIGRIYDTVKETAGEENAKNALRAIRADLKLTGRVAEDTENAIVRVSNGSVKRTWFGEINQAEQNLLETQKKVNAMYGEQKKEADEATNGANNLAEAYKKAEEEFKEANAIVEKMKANRSAYTDEQWNKWTEELKKRKQALEDLGGDPDGKQAKKNAAAASKAAKDYAAERKKLFELQQKELEEQQQRREDLEDALADLAIANERDNARRELMQLEKDHKEKLDAINKQADEWKKAAYKAAEERFNATNKQKGVTFADTDEGKAGWQAQNLTAEQKAIIQAWEDQQTAIHNRAIEERILAEEKANREAISTYIKQYGSYAEKKQDIYDTANEEICELERQLSSATTDEAREAIEARIDMVRKGTESQIEELDQQYGKAKQFMIDLFGDASKKSIGEIDRIIKKYEALVKFMEGDGSISREKLVTDFGFDEAEIDQALNKLHDGKITVKEFTDALKNLKSDLGERSPWTKFKNNVTEALQKIKNASGDSKGSQIGAGITTLGESIQQITPELDTLAEGLGNCFNVDTSGLKDAIKTLKELGGIVEGIGQIAQKNYVGGAISIISSLGSILSGLFDDDSNERVRKSIDRRIEVANERLKDLTEALDRSYGVEAQRLANAAREEAGSKQEAAREGFVEALMNEGFSGIFKRISLANYVNEIFGTHFDSHTKEGYKGAGAFMQNLSNDDYAKIMEAIYENEDAFIYFGENVGKYVKEFLEIRKDLEEIDRKEMERIVSTPLDTVIDDAMSALTDFANGSEDVFDDVASNWQEMVNKMIVNNLVGTELQQNLTRWYGELNALQQEYNSGIIDEENFKSRLSDLRTAYDGYIDDARQDVAHMKEIGVIVSPSAKDEEPVKTYFADLRESWKSTLTDMSGDAKSWKEGLLDTIFGDLVEGTVLNVPLSLTTTEAEKGEQTFEDFGAYLKDWTERYKQVIEDQTLADADRTARLRSLVAEQEQLREGQAAKSKALAASIGIDMRESFNSSLDNLGDTLLNALLDADTTAEGMGKKIAQDLIREMLTTMLESDKYAERMKDIRKKWQKLLSGKEVDYTMNDVLNDIADLNKDIASDETISKLADQYKGLNKELEKTETVFSNLHDTFKNTLYSMEDDAKSFRKKLSETMLKDLIDKQVLDVPFTINGMTFENFEAYSKDWNKRYAKAIADGDSALLDQLIEELVNARQLTIDAAEEFRKRIKELEKSGDTTFSGMTDSFTSALMDMNTDADEWAQEIGKTISRRIVEQMLVAKSIQPLLDNLQDAFNEAMSADGATYQSVVADAAVQRELSAITASYPALKDAVQDLLKSLGVTLEESAEQELSLDDLGSTLLDSLTSAEDSAEDFGKRIGQTLIRQMLEALISADYGEEIERIRKHWDLALKGVSDESGVTYTLDDVRKEIFDLRKEMSEDGAIENLTSDFLSLNEAAAAADSTFKSLGDTLTSSLTDVTKSADDIGREIGQRLSQKIVQELIVGKHLQPYLDDIQEAFDVAVSATGSTPASVLSAVTPKIDAAVAATERWKSAAEAVGEAFRKVENESTPLSGLRSSILSDLMDIESDAKDFATDMTKLLTEAFVDKFVLGEAFDKKLKEWESEYRRIMGDPTLGDSGRSNELKRLGETIASYRQVKSEEAKTIQSLMGYAKGVEDQSAYMNTAERITYEQADWIGGVMTNLYMNQIEGNKVREAILSTLRGMERIGVGGGGYGEQIYNRLSTMSTYLLEIRNDVHAHLAEINAKVGQTNQLLGG